MIRSQLLFAFLLLSIWACKEESLEPVLDAPDRVYFPLELGQTRYYATDSITLIPVVNGTRYDTAKLEVREQLLDTFRGPDDRLWFRGERWDRRNASAPWRFRQTFSLSADNQAAFRREDNLQFTKLVFPARAGERWDGNAAFDEFTQLVIGGEFLDVYAGWEYNYLNVGEANTLATGLAFDETVRVGQAEIDNLIDFRDAYEIYAAGVGLVERYIDARHTQCQLCCGGVNTGLCLDLPWDEKAEKGYIIHEILSRVE